jgi:hypothetical protein
MCVCGAAYETLTLILIISTLLFPVIIIQPSESEIQQMVMEILDRAFEIILNETADIVLAEEGERMQVGDLSPQGALARDRVCMGRITTWMGR